MQNQTIELQQGNSLLSLQTQGAQVLNWICDGKEQLFLSAVPVDDPAKPKRGGVPIIFPQFAAFGDLPKHGFARDLPWSIAERPSGNEIVLELNHSEQTLTTFPYAFRARFMLTLGRDSLAMYLAIKNLSAKTFEFTAALHTYFGIDDLTAVELQGLQGSQFWNNGEDLKVRHPSDAIALRPGQIVEEAGLIDRVYFDTNRHAEALTLLEGERKRTVVGDGFADTVVWNPGPAGAKALADMEDEDYQRMLCVESASIETPVSLPPEETWQAGQIITCC